MSLLRSGVLLLFLIVATTYGQITIESGDLLDLIGNSNTVQSDRSSSTITVDVGSAGANQTWDLTGISFIDPMELTLEFVSPGDTPFADDFPTSNLAYSIPFDEFGYTGVGYNYIQVMSDQVTSLGFGAKITDPDSSIINTLEEDVVPLPLSYGDSWTSTSIDTFEYLPGFGTITITNTESLVDGHGTVQLKAGNFECLRLRDDYEEISLTLISGQVAFADTISSISYNWVGKESILLAEIEGMDGEDDPNFTQAGYVQLTSSLEAPNALIQDGSMVLPKQMVLYTNFPNPFNPSTTIRFDLAETGVVDLSIFDLTGRRIVSLVDGSLAAGSHQISWNGRDVSGISVASGIYIYRLQSMGRVMSRKLTLLR